MRHQHFKVPQYDIHPISIKMITRGHPWITKDKYSEKFAPRDRFIVALNRKKPFGLFIHDPTHKFVSARLWAKSGNFDKLAQNFKKDLSQRINDAIRKREADNIQKDRSNFYLIYGESDQLPGLMVQLLGNQVLIQYYCYFWENYQDQLVKEIITKLSNVFDIDITRSNIWVQKRGQAIQGQSPAKCLDPNIAEYKFNITEFGVKYELILGRHYDFGIYTDMSGVRNKVLPHIQNAKKVLNLFSYTGAYSLFALKNDCDVVSVDLSEQYLEWLDTNISLNADIDPKRHVKFQGPVNSYLKSSKEKFDLIISDPPSSSSDGKKKTSAIKEYENTLSQLVKLLEPKGELILFLNTHNINMNKFKQKITEIIETQKLKLRILSHLSTYEDCPQMRGFPEGSYLKGLVLKKND